MTAGSGSPAGPVRSPGAGRGQASLLSVAVALVLLTGVTVVGVAFAEGALAAADRDPAERRAAVVLADRLVAAGAPTAFRPNVLNRSATADLTPAALDRLAPPVDGRPVRVRLDGETVVERGDPDPRDATTVRRLVRVGTRTPRTRRVDLSRDSVTLPGPTPRIELTFPDAGSGVETVRVDDRVVLHDPDNLTGTAVVRTGWTRNATLWFLTPGGDPGSVTVTYYRLETSTATLEVTVGD